MYQCFQGSDGKPGLDMRALVSRHRQAVCSLILCSLIGIISDNLQKGHEISCPWALVHPSEVRKTWWRPRAKVASGVSQPVSALSCTLIKPGLHQ